MRQHAFPGGQVLILAGELDAFDAPVLRAAFAALTMEGVIVLDLAAVTFLDSSALGTIVGLHRRSREAGGELRVVLPDGEARRIFEITRLDRVLDVWESGSLATARSRSSATQA